MKNLIFASSKPWHKKGFDKFKKKFKFNCYYVSTPKQLQLALKKKIIFNIYFSYTGIGKFLQKFIKNMNVFVFI